MAAGRLASDRTVAAVGPSRALGVGALLTLAGLIVVVGVARPLPAAAGLGLAGLGLAPVAPVAFSLTGYQADVPSPQAVAAVSTIGYGAFLAGPALVGGTAELWGLRVAISLLAVVVLALFLLARGIPDRHPLLAEDRPEETGGQGSPDRPGDPGLLLTVTGSAPSVSTSIQP